MATARSGSTSVDMRDARQVVVLGRFELAALDRRSGSRGAGAARRWRSRGAVGAPAVSVPGKKVLARPKPCPPLDSVAVASEMVASNGHLDRQEGGERREDGEGRAGGDRARSRRTRSPSVLRPRTRPAGCRGAAAARRQRGRARRDRRALMRCPRGRRRPAGRSTSSGGPTARMRPWPMTTTRSANGDHAGELLDDDGGDPASARPRTTSNSSATIVGARPIDSSSSRITAGSVVRARASGEHLLLAARQGAGQLVASLAEPREAAVGHLLEVGWWSGPGARTCP